MNLEVGLHDGIPDDWSETTEFHGGGFFHSPAALLTALPSGDPVAVVLKRDGQPTGVALGVRQRCRLGIRANHVAFAAPPTLRGGYDARKAHGALIEALRRTGAVEVSINSFDAAGEVPITGHGRPTRKRHEHVVPLDGDPDEVLQRFGSSHRRYARRGDRNEWTLSMLAGEEASEALYRVQSEAGERAAERGEEFTPEPVPPAGLQESTLDAPHGLAVFAARDGDQDLGSALVGWGAGRAFYLQGGSTSRGYDEHAAVWLHFAIARTLLGHGFTAYNLGGTPSDAEDPDHPQHGLYRFKQHFGAEQVECRGAHWAIDRVHLGLHRALRGVRRWISTGAGG